MTIPAPMPIGKRFGRLLVIGDAGKLGPNRWARCLCSCGNEKDIRLTHLDCGLTLSCGCWRKEVSRTRCTTHGLSLAPNGLAAPLFTAWVNMRRRCTDKKRKLDYPRYGGRGIKVCGEWEKSFLAFYRWAKAHGYSEGLTLDRIDNNGNYQPDNCRWVDRKVQNGNRRNNHRITYHGKTKILAQWARELGVPANRLSYRLRRGWSVHRAFTTPKMKNKYVFDDDHLEVGELPK